MKKYSKKLALILVLSLTLAIGIPAVAADGTTEITGTYDPPVVAVLLPGNTDAIINPYGLPVDIYADNGNNVVGTMEKNQIVAATPLAGCNLSKVDLKIGASVIGSPSANFRLATEKPDAESTLKTGLVYLEVKAVDDLGYTNTPDTSVNIGNFDGAKIVNALNTWAKSTFTGEEGSDSQVLVKTTAVKKTGLATLKAADASGAPVSQSYFVARLGSDIVKAPRKERAATDKLDVTVTWILEPAT